MGSSNPELEPEVDPENAQDRPEHIRRKRRRRTIACAQCRSRKVKCDLEYPTCGRCRKGPWPDACVYESPAPAWQQRQHQPQQQQNPLSSSTGSRDPSVKGSALSNSHDGCVHNTNGTAEPRPSVYDQNRDGNQRIRELERALQLLTQQTPSTATSYPSKADTESPRLPDVPSAREESSVPRDQRKLGIPSRSLMGGKETKTRFFGCSNVSSLASEVSGSYIYSVLMCSECQNQNNEHDNLIFFLQFNLKSYIDKVKASNPFVVKTQHELSLMRPPKPAKPLSGELSLDNTFLRGMLPPRSVAENLVDCYFSYIGRTHRVLHKPSFYRDFRTLWEEPQSVPSSFIVQVFLVMAIVWSVNTPSPLNAAGDRVLSHAIALDWIYWSENWLFHADIKRPNLVVLQVRCLLLLAKEANYTQRNQAWSATGTLIKLAMSAGCHREPAPEARVSVFNREMRRRIWATVVELDLQASLDRGMLPTVQRSDYDTMPPLNINDEDIYETIISTPQPKPVDVATDSSFQVALSQSVGVRLKICALVNAPRITISSEELWKFDDEILHHLSEIPSWRTTDPTDVLHSRQVVLWRSLIQFNLRRSQLSLHSCCALGKLQEPSLIHSRQARLESAVEILCQHQLLIDHVGKLAWCAMNDNTFQAVFTICHHLLTSDSGLSESRPDDCFDFILYFFFFSLLTAFSFLDFSVFTGSASYS